MKIIKSKKYAKDEKFKQKLSLHFNKGKLQMETNKTSQINLLDLPSFYQNLSEAQGVLKDILLLLKNKTQIISDQNENETIEICRQVIRNMMQNVESKRSQKITKDHKR